MAVRSCLVTLNEPGGARHSTTVQAESVFEAAALGLAAFKQDGWCGTIGPASRLGLQVLEPSVVHSVQVQQVQRWLDGGGTNPNEQARKSKLKAMIG